MSDANTFPPYTKQAVFNSINSENSPMPTKQTYTVLLRHPQPQPGARLLYLLPKAVADYNKTTGKGLVV